jgi:hypothetical protein
LRRIEGIGGLSIFSKIRVEIQSPSVSKFD